jgi:prepilin-type N-terminal cleavage/methylation domain-containing protein
LAGWPVGRFNPLTRKLANRQTGFSLIELIISMAILSVGLFAGIRVFPVGLGASKRAELRSRAAFAAQRTIESMKLTPWDDLATGETTTEVDGFTVTTSIRAVTPEGLVDASRLKAVDVSVAWTQDGRPRQISFVTYLRKPSS